MVSISDARMSGTAYGTVVLHAVPEAAAAAAAGGTLALVHYGDMLELNVPERKIQLLVNDEELAKRRAAWTAPAPAVDSEIGSCTSTMWRKPMTVPTWTFYAASAVPSYLKITTKSLTCL